MQSFNLLNTIYLTFVETGLNLYFSLLIVGESRFLPLKDLPGKERINNILRLGIVIILISFFTDTAAIFVPDMNLKSLISMAFSALVICAVYRISIIKSVLAVIVFIGLLLSVESPYITTIISLVFKNLQNLYACEPNIRFLYSLPIRVLQLAGILTVWDIKLAIEYSKKANIKMLAPISTLVLLIIIETSMYSSFLTALPVMPFLNKIVGFIGMFCIGPVNFLIIHTYISTISKLILYNHNKTERSDKDEA